MNKKILTAAIGAAMIAGPLAAQAELKIGGRVAGSLTSNNSVVNFVDFGNTRIQFDAKDDSGWYARMAWDMRPSGALSNQPAGILPMRDSLVGIKSGMGDFSFGRIAGAVKNIEGDPFIATFLQYRTAFVKGGAYGSSSFVNQIIQYSTKAGDASIKVQFNPVSAGSGSNGDAALAVKAKMAGANVFLGWNNEGNVAGGGFYKVGGNMKFGDIKATAIYESDTTGGAAVTTWVLGGAMSLGDGASVDASYSDKGSDGVNAAYRLAYMKKASKKARWWVGYTQNGSSSANTATYGAGARVDF